MKKCKKQKKNAKKSKGKKSGITTYKKVKTWMKQILFWALLTQGLYGVAKELLKAIFWQLK